MKNQEVSSQGCISYAPGHNVHWIQARVKYNEPRYDAAVEILNETTLRVRYLDAVEIFHHHNVPAIKENLKQVVLNYIKFSPTAALLYLQTEEPNGLHKGVFAVHYLSNTNLCECACENVRLCHKSSPNKEFEIQRDNDKEG
jgi:hypothetical protein